MAFPVIWSPALKQFTLPTEEIHVWRASLNLDAAVMQRLKSNLCEDEISRADRFHFDCDRDHFIAARGILRELLSLYLNESPAAIRLIYGPQGKPALLENDEARLHFNLSHSHGLSVLAFAHAREVGIDLEPIRRTFAGDDIAERYFSAAELVELRALPSWLKTDGFFLCWTRKEAYIKARGEGLHVPLDSFTVSLTPGQPEKLQSSDELRWKLQAFEPAEKFAGALVGEGQDWRARFWEWNPFLSPNARAGK